MRNNGKSLEGGIVEVAYDDTLIIPSSLSDAASFVASAMTVLERTKMGRVRGGRRRRELRGLGLTGK